MSNPIDEYDNKTVGEVEDAVTPYTNGLSSISDSDVVGRLDLVNEVLTYERENKNRTTAKRSIIEVRDEIKAEAESRDLLTPEERDREPEEAEDDESDATVGSSDDEDPDDGDDTADEEDEAETEEDEPEDDEDDPVIEAPDGTQHIRVRNHKKTAQRIAGKSFGAGEVKNLVLNDQVRIAIERRQLQVVSQR